MDDIMRGKGGGRGEAVRLSGAAGMSDAAQYGRCVVGGRDGRGCPRAIGGSPPGGRQTEGRRAMITNRMLSPGEARVAVVRG